MTFGDMCEQIATWLREQSQDKIVLTGRQIWNLSSTGEVWPIMALNDYMQQDAFGALVADDFLFGLVVQQLGDAPR